MRYRVLFLIIAAGLSACSLQSQVVKPDSGIPVTDFPQITSTSLPGLEIRTATPTVLPTFTAWPTVTSSPVPVNVGTYTIRFAPGGTYVDIIDGILFGTSKTYSVSAFKGQVMSVSVNLGMDAQWSPVPMHISGVDGNVLCASNEDQVCATSWRGILPSTQEYLITLAPPVDIRDFMLRVAIDPPGTTTQSFLYRSPVSGALFSYTDEFAPVRAPIYQSTRTDPELSLSYIDTRAFVDTNLVEAYVLYGVSYAAEVVADCLEVSPEIPNEKIAGERIVNGRRFVRFEGGGAATGNFYEQIMFRTSDGSACHELGLLIHSFSTGALLPQKVVQEYDRTALIDKFEKILASLVIK